MLQKGGITENMKGWYLTMDLEKTVCYCMSVTSGMIKDAVDSGANTLEEVQGITSAGTVCGSCLEDVKRLVEQFVSERDGQ